MDLAVGQILDGKYRILKELGSGSMGAVYLGENVRIKRQVAIKVLHPALGADAEVVRRFEKEAEAAGQIGSEHIVAVLDIGSAPTGERYLVMELLEGEALEARIARGRLAPEDAVPLVLELLDGLAAAHAAGIIHRDLKPDNVFLLSKKAGKKDFVKILDFGISKFNTLGGDPSQATRADAIMGTPYYMSPEQARSSVTADARSDLYSVAVILYEAVTQAVPFDADSYTGVLFKAAFEEPTSPTAHVPDLDPGIVEILVKGMARAPADRFQTAAEMKAALEAWLAARPGPATRVPPTQTGPKGTLVFGEAAHPAALAEPAPQAAAPPRRDALAESAPAAAPPLVGDAPAAAPPLVGDPPAAAVAAAPEVADARPRAAGAGAHGSWEASPAAARQARSGTLLLAVLAVLAVAGGALAAWRFAPPAPAAPAPARPSARATAPAPAPSPAPGSTAGDLGR